MSWNPDYLSKNDAPAESTLVGHEPSAEEMQALATGKLSADAFSNVLYATIPDGETSGVWKSCHGRTINHVSS